jgi:hypothetical protein
MECGMRAPLHVLVFAVVGSAISAFIIESAQLVVFLSQADNTPVRIVVQAAGIMTLFYYVVCLIPTILTGIFDYKFRHRHGFAAISLVGGMTTFIAFVFLVSHLETYALVTLAGAFSALTCHLLMKRLSPIPKLDNSTPGYR